MSWARKIWPSPFLFLVSVKSKMWRLLPFGGSKSSKFPLRGNAFRIDLPIYIHEHWIPPSLPFHFPLYMYTRTTDTQRGVFFCENPKLLGLGRQIGMKSFGAFGVFSANLSAPILIQRVLCSRSALFMFSMNQPLILQKTKPLYSIWIWAAKN